ncbi:hypothetical protein [Thalassospira sp.]|uniref:hypothetical protein n=1 Tax=Thalassospira sp. TaxID=1912094 RepID=UPI00311D4ED9
MDGFAAFLTLQSGYLHPEIRYLGVHIRAAVMRGMDGARYLLCCGAGVARSGSVWLGPT